MKSIPTILSCLLILLLSNNCLSQTNIKEEKIKFLDYCAAQLIHLSLNMSSSDGVSAQFKNECPCYNDDSNTPRSYEDFKCDKIGMRKGIDDKKQFEKDNALQILEEFKKLKKETNGIDIAYEIIIYGDDSYPDYPKIAEWSGDEKVKSESQDRKDQLKKIQDSISIAYTEVKAIQEQTPTTETVNETKNFAVSEEIQTNKGSNVSSIIALILSIAALILGIISMIYHRDLKGEIKKLKYKFDKSQNTQQVAASPTNANNVSRRELEILGRELETKIQNIENRARQQSNEPVRQFTKSTVDAPKKIYFYMTSYIENNAFVEEASDIKKENSMYEFEKTNDHTAQFKLINIKSALVDKFNNIEPFCNASNDYNNRTNITTNKPGLVEHDGQHWVIKKKAEITYC